jgi:hypothetical protein
MLRRTKSTSASPSHYTNLRPLELGVVGKAYLSEDHEVAMYIGAISAHEKLVLVQISQSRFGHAQAVYLSMKDGADFRADRR